MTKEAILEKSPYSRRKFHIIVQNAFLRAARVFYYIYPLHGTLMILVDLSPVCALYVLIYRKMTPAHITSA